MLAAVGRIAPSTESIVASRAGTSTWFTLHVPAPTQISLPSKTPEPWCSAALSTSPATTGVPATSPVCPAASADTSPWLSDAIGARSRRRSPSSPNAAIAGSFRPSSPRPPAAAQAVLSYRPPAEASDNSVATTPVRRARR